MYNERQRIQWVDIAKGITILLVVIAHTSYNGNIARVIINMICSFHMPFFFIMSGLTANFPSSIDMFMKKTKKLFLSLIIPTFIAYFSREIINVFINKTCISIDYFFSQLYTLLFFYADKTYYQNYPTYALGFIWFLPVLFLCRTLINYLSLVVKKEHLPLIVCLFSILGYTLSAQQHQYIFAFDIILTVLPFLLLGYYLKTINFSKRPYKYTLLCFFIWCFCFFIQNSPTPNARFLNIIFRDYPLYPFCFFTAAIGTIFMCYFSYLLSKICISKFFALIGKNSIIFLLVHYFDFLLGSIWKSFSNQYVCLIVRLAFDIVICLLLLFTIFVLKNLKKVFKKEEEIL